MLDIFGKYSDCKLSVVCSSRVKGLANTKAVLQDFSRLLDPSPVVPGEEDSNLSSQEVVSFPFLVAFIFLGIVTVFENCRGIHGLLWLVRPLSVLPLQVIEGTRNLHFVGF